MGAALYALRPFFFMSYTTLFKTASGTNTTNATYALVQDGFCAVMNSGVSLPSILVKDQETPNMLATDGIAGVTVTVTTVGTGGPPSLGSFGHYIEASDGDYSPSYPQDPRLSDANDATYLTSSILSLCVFNDLGASSPVDRCKFVFSGALGEVYSIDYRIAYSNDGTTWTDLPGGTGSVLYGTTTVDLSFAAITARYWRAGIIGAVHAIEDGGVSPGHVRINTFDQYYSGTRYTSDPIGTERLQAALTLDGSTAATSYKSATVPASNGTVTFGGIADTWGIALTRADVASTSFGVMLKRGDALGGECTTTARNIDCVRMDVETFDNSKINKYWRDGGDHSPDAFRHYGAESIVREPPSFPVEYVPEFVAKKTPED